METETIFETLVHTLIPKNMHLATAESLTGGMLSSAVVDVPGASKTFAGGFVVYCDEAKQTLLDVEAETLQKNGAISSETARQMAKGAAEKLGVEVALATTGNAGPDPAEGKPVGLVFLGLSINGTSWTKECHFKGDRGEIRRQSVVAAAEFCLQKLADI